jgi:hypothetical protein
VRRVKLLNNSITMCAWRTKNLLILPLTFLAAEHGVYETQCPFVKASVSLSCYFYSVVKSWAYIGKQTWASALIENRSFTSYFTRADIRPSDRTRPIIITMSILPCKLEGNSWSRTQLVRTLHLALFLAWIQQVE